MSLFFQDYMICPALGNTKSPHPEDCSKFIECSDGLYMELSCPGDLLFDAISLECTFPESTVCFSEPPDTPTPEPFNPEGECPPINPEFVFFLKDLYDCTVFYKCNWGTPIKFKCPDGLHFNKKLDVCDWPLYAGCAAPPVFIERN